MQRSNTCRNLGSCATVTMHCTVQQCLLRLVLSIKPVNTPAYVVRGMLCSVLYVGHYCSWLVCLCTCVLWFGPMNHTRDRQVDEGTTPFVHARACQTHSPRVLSRRLVGLTQGPHFTPSLGVPGIPYNRYVPSDGPSDSDWPVHGGASCMGA